VLKTVARADLEDRAGFIAFPVPAAAVPR